MNKKNSSEIMPKRSPLSKFFLATAICWFILWTVYVLSGIPIVMLTKSVAYEPADMTAGESLLLSIGNALHTGLRWTLPALLPFVWIIVRLTTKTADEQENKLLAKCGLTSILTAIALLIILGCTHALLPIDELRAGSGIVNNLLIRLHAMLTASPVGLAAVAYTMLARYCGKTLNIERLHSFGRSAVIAAGAMLGVTLLAAFVTVIKGTWMSIDWIVILPLAASVIYECSRASKQLNADNE